MAFDHQGVAVCNLTLEPNAGADRQLPMLIIRFAISRLMLLNTFCVASNFVQLIDHSWIDIGWGRAWLGHLCFCMDWLLISAKHDLGVLQKPTIANIVYIDIPNERLTALETRSWTPSKLATERSRSTAPAL